MEGEAYNYQKPSRGADVLVLPYSLQGHLNPILQFSKRLAYTGLQVTVLIPTSISNQVFSKDVKLSSSFEFIQIFDGFKEEPDKNDLDTYLNCLKVGISQSLYELLDHYKRNSDNLQPTPKVVIYDSFMPWVLDVVRNCGVGGAPFFTQSCVVNFIYYNVYRGALNTPTSKSDLISIPCIRSFFKVDDLPSFVSSPGLYPNVLVRLILVQLSNVGEADFVFVNTMNELEIEVVNWMASRWTVKTIGPCIPSKYLDKRILDDADYGISLFQPQTDDCKQWLDARGIGSVVYVSMGSMASLGGEQMEEMVSALEKSNQYYLWVVRASEVDKLPPNFKPKCGKGLIVNWCPQLEVLAHPALGCFVTHCGWNSTLEAISLGVPMVAFPQWTDQPTNAKCIKDFWRIGVRVRVDDNGFATREEIELCIRQVMEGERAKEIRNNATKYKQLAKESMGKGGSSTRNIEEFVAKLLPS